MSVTYNDTQIASIVRKEYAPALVNNAVNNEDPVTMRLLNDAEKMSGESLVIPIKKAKSSAGGSYGGFDTLSTAAEQTRTNAEFEEKRLYQSITLDNLDIVKGKGKEAVLDHVKTSVEEAQMDLADTFSTQLYSDGTGNSSKDLTGLDAVCDDGTNVATYGNINRSTESYWQGNYTNSAAVLSTSIMATHFDECSDAGEMPTMIVTTYDLWSKLESLLAGTQQTNINGYAKLASSSKQKKQMEFGINSGFNAISFRGVPVVASKYVTAGRMYFLNEKYLKMKYFEQGALDRTGLKNGFAITKNLEPVNQDGKVMRVHWYGNVVCDRPGRQAVRRGLTTS